MSTTSFCYHTLGTTNYQYLTTKYEGKQVYLHMEKHPGKQTCAKCKSPAVIQKGKIYREIKTLPIGDKGLVLSLHLHRLECKACGTTALEELEVANAKKHYSKKLAAWVLDLLPLATIRDVARITGLSWDQVKEIDKTYLQKHYAEVAVQQLHRIAIDEFYIGQRLQYVTLVTDLDSGHIVFAGKGKDGSCLKPFFKKLKRNHVRLEAVAMDMGKAYIAAVHHYLPGTPIVFDHFHVVKLVNSKLDELRRQVTQQADAPTLPVKKGLRWILLKNPEHLTAQQKPLLAQLLELNTPLMQAYLLKEQFRSFWDYATKDQALAFIQQWLQEVRTLGFPCMTALATSIEAHLDGMLAYFDHPISSGKMEGLNNKIATLLKKAYGCRDLDYFMLKVKALHRSRYALVG